MLMFQCSFSARSAVTLGVTCFHTEPYCRMLPTLDGWHGGAVGTLKMPTGFGILWLSGLSGSRNVFYPSSSDIRSKGPLILIILDDEMRPSNQSGRYMVWIAHGL